HRAGGAWRDSAGGGRPYTAGPTPSSVSTTMVVMAWFTRGQPVSPTAQEAEALWDDEPPATGRDVGVLRLVDAFQTAGRPPSFTGWVEAGSFRTGQGVLLHGRSGFARGVVGDIAKGREFVREISARTYCSVEVRNINVR